MSDDVDVLIHDLDREWQKGRLLDRVEYAFHRATLDQKKALVGAVVRAAVTHGAGSSRCGTFVQQVGPTSQNSSEQATMYQQALSALRKIVLNFEMAETALIAVRNSQNSTTPGRQWARRQVIEQLTGTYPRLTWYSLPRPKL